mgnify:FL=1
MTAVNRRLWAMKLRVDLFMASLGTKTKKK